MVKNLDTLTLPRNTTHKRIRKKVCVCIDIYTYVYMYLLISNYRSIYADCCRAPFRESLQAPLRRQTMAVPQIIIRSP